MFQSSQQGQRYQLTLRGAYLLALLGLLGVLNFILFAPFINIIVVAFLVVEIFYPLYRFLKNRLNNEAIASILSTIVAFIFVTVPLALIVLVTAGETVSFTRQAQQFLITNQDTAAALPQMVVDSANQVLANLNVSEQFRLADIDLNSVVNEVGSTLVSAAGTIAGQLLAGGVGLVFQVFLLIVSMLFLFQLRSGLRDKVSRLSPLDNDLDRLFFDKFTATTRAVIRGSAVVAVLQATAVILVMVLMGVGAPVLLWIIMILASLVPVGSGIIWFPAGVIMILTGQAPQGIFLIVYSAIIINVIDTLVRPYLMRGATQLHPLVTLFSVLGGIALFGVIGILYGPILAVMFLSLLHVYNTSQKLVAADGDTEQIAVG